MFIAELLNVDLAEEIHTNSSADVVLTGQTLARYQLSLFYQFVLNQQVKLSCAPCQSSGSRSRIAECL
jgi:hypothetical protein